MADVSRQLASSISIRSSRGCHHSGWSRYQTHGARETLVEVDLGVPTEGVTDLAAVEKIAPVVTGPVRDVGLQRGVEAEQVEDAIRDAFDVDLDSAADVVGLTGDSAVENPLDGAGSGRRRGATRGGCGYAGTGSAAVR